MLLETLSISQQVWCQGWNARVELARVVLQGDRRAGGSLLCLPDPLSNQKVYGGFGRPAVGIQKRKIMWERNGRDETPEIWECQRGPTNNIHPRPPANPSLSPGSQISICGSNDPASGPCGQRRSRPVIKMKWAAFPMVPFRRLQHWPRDLYLIDQPVKREKSSFPLERPVPHSASLFQSKCLKKKRRIAFLTQFGYQLCWY